MRHQTRRNARDTALLLATAAVLVWMPGCATNGYQKGDSAAVSMQRSATEVQAEGRAMDQTLRSLEALVSAQDGDLRAPFKRYCRSLDRLVSAAQRTENTGRTMDQKSAAYIQAWDQQLQTIDYQHIRDLSEARRNEVTNHLEAISRRYRESQEAVQPLISYLTDIRKALSADLTVAGLESLRGIAQNANDNVVKVQTALDALTAELTNSSARLSSVAYNASQGIPQDRP